MGAGREGGGQVSGAITRGEASALLSRIGDGARFVIEPTAGAGLRLFVETRAPNGLSTMVVGSRAGALSVEDALGAFLAMVQREVQSSPSPLSSSVTTGSVT